MFDRYVLGHGRAVSHHHRADIAITENRAPTDESVRLLSEMEAAAEKKLIGAFPLADNGLEGKVFVLNEPQNAALRAVARVKINGREIEATATVEPWRFPVAHEMRGKLLHDLRDALAQRIAAEFLMSMGRISWP